MQDVTPVHLSFDGRPLAAREVMAPLVSVVVINHNYAEFVGAALDSIRRQDYPYFECIIVDNGSTDASRAVIERHIDSDPRFSTLYLAENLGQLGAANRLLDRLRGAERARAF